MHKIIHKKLFGLSAAVCLSLTLMTDPAAAQSSSQGNTVISEGTQMTVFGAHTFLTGGAGILPGIIQANRSATPGILGFGPGATYSGDNNANHVDGYVSKAGTDAFLFPVGNGSRIGRIGISAPGTSSVFKAAYWFGNPGSATLPAGGPFPATSKGDDVTAVSTVEYWDLDGSEEVDVTLQWDATSNLAALSGANLATIVVVGYNPVTTAWESLGNAGTTGTLATAGSVTATNVTPNKYSAFTFGTNSALPVTLISFNARKENSITLLNWATTAETNSDRFEIERSANGKVWNKIGTVASSKESSSLVNYDFKDSAPLNGENLYRLKMIDQDETFAHSAIVSVTFEGITDQIVYPNPSRDVVYIQNPQQVTRVSITDLRGNSLLDSVLATDGIIRVDGLNAGMYVVKVVRKDGSVKSQKIVVTK